MLSLKDRCDLLESDLMATLPRITTILFYPGTLDSTTGLRFMGLKDREALGNYSERTAMASAPIGTLVTLDKIFELVEGNLSTEKRKDISDIAQRFKDDLEDCGMAVRVAKTLCLLEFVRDLPRTEANIAACLVNTVGQPAPLAAVQKSLKKLYDAQFIRNTEEGWKLQTAQEKNWETERRSLEPKQKDRNDILHEILRDVFSDPRLKTYRFRDLRNFPVGISVDGTWVGDEGKVPLSIVITVNTRPRTRPKRRNAERVRQRAFRHIQWEWEEVGAFPYRPTTCQQTSRVVGLRTHLRITQGDGRPGHADPVRLVHDPRPGDDAAPGRGLSS